jgi:PAS domain S-box-containing protein
VASFSESDGIFRELTESAPLGVFVVQDGVFRYVNASFAAMFNYNVAEVIDSLDPLDLIAPDDVVAIQQHFERLNSGTAPTLHCVARGLTRENRVISVDIHATRARHRAAPAIVGIAQDVTARLHADEELRRSATEFRRIVDNMIDTFYRTDLNGRLVLASPSAFDLLGWTPEELLGRRLADLYVDPRGRDAFLSKLQQSGGRATGYETELWRKDGGKVWVETNAHYFRDDNGRVCGVEGTVRNITDRKRVEAELRESEERFRRMQELSSAGIGVHEGGTITDCNQSLARITGYDYSELIGMDGVLLIAPEHRDVARENIRNGYEQPYISVGLRKDGTTYPLEVTGKNIPFNGRSYRVTEFQDITNRARADQEREALQRQLQQAQKMEAIGLLTGGIAHDFNNIMTSILGFTQLAIAHSAGNGDHKLSDYLRCIASSGERAANLVTQILAFSRDSVPGVLKPLALETSLDEVLAMLRPTLPSNIGIEREYADGVPRIGADPGQLHQLMTNLCINARDAMTEGGTLRVSVRGLVRCGGECASCHELFDGEYVELSVSDSGPGISPDLLNHVFQPFFTTKDVGKGTGMGLAVVHGIVHRFNGHIVVESIHGKGSTFRVLLPALANDVAPSHDAPAPIAAAEPNTHDATKRARLLLVDDEELLCRFFSEVLGSSGYHVAAYTNPLDALAAFERNPHAFDLVLTDQTMPGLTGRDLLTRLHARRTDLPVVMCTGYSEHLDETKAKALGAAAFLAKPIDMGRLLEVVAHITQRSEASHGHGRAG